jgi:hypothetical protein
MSRKVIHLENKTTSEHKYYGSLVALWNDNDGFPYHRVKRLNLSQGWENETFKIRLGVLLTPSDVEAGIKNGTSDFPCKNS